jgi:seryl-tRNA synthetase
MTKDKFDTNQKEVRKLGARVVARNNHIAGLKEERDAISAQIKIKEEEVSNYRTDIVSLMINMGKQSIMSTRVSMSLRKVSATCKVLNVDALPKGLFELVRKPLTEDIKEQYKATGDIPSGCEEIAEGVTLVVTAPK